MIELIKNGMYLLDCTDIVSGEELKGKYNIEPDSDKYKKGTMSYKILEIEYKIWKFISL